jgi:hypothetical protein
MGSSSLDASARMMRVVGWLTLLALPIGFVVYPAGFLWGTHPSSPHHPPLSPYLFMLLAMYAAWAALMIRGARDPLANRAIVDYGILANLVDEGTARRTPLVVIPVKAGAMLKLTPSSRRGPRRVHAPHTRSRGASKGPAIRRLSGRALIPRLLPGP